ncbi:MAG: sigma 54 modulation/S30EA ribosomal C-terminal domain-containing protein [Acidimicrobiia bacterium]
MTDEVMQRPSTHSDPQLGLSPASHPLEVARVWARCLEAGRLDVGLTLYAGDAVVHVDDDVVLGQTDLRGYLERSPLYGIDSAPVIRGENGTIQLRWMSVGASPSIEVRCRVEQGQIVEQWISEVPPEGTILMVTTPEGPLEMTIVTHGHVTEDACDYAYQRLRTVIEHIDEPVLFARVKLTHAPDPARDRPAIAQVAVDVNGQVVRAQIGAHTMREAIDLLQGRLRDKIEHRAQRRHALRTRAAMSPPGEWRHGDPPTERPSYFDRPHDERELVRHKGYVVDELTPDEAVFDMEQRDFDFYLFREMATGDDALVERGPDGSYRLTRLRPTSIETPATAVTLDVAEQPAPVLGVDDAVERINANGEQFVFFANEATGRGNVIYHRYDGHYGLVAPD